jgi:hypothetical protein
MQASAASWKLTLDGGRAIAYLAFDDTAVSPSIVPRKQLQSKQPEMATATTS